MRDVTSVQDITVPTVTAPIFDSTFSAFFNARLSRFPSVPRFLSSAGGHLRVSSLLHPGAIDEVCPGALYRWRLLSKSNQENSRYR